MNQISERLSYTSKLTQPEKRLHRDLKDIWDQHVGLQILAKHPLTSDAAVIASLGQSDNSQRTGNKGDLRVL